MSCGRRQRPLTPGQVGRRAGGPDQGPGHLPLVGGPRAQQVRAALHPPERGERMVAWCTLRHHLVADNAIYMEVSAC